MSEEILLKNKNSVNSIKGLRQKHNRIKLSREFVILILSLVANIALFSLFVTLIVLFIKR